MATPAGDKDCNGGMREKARRDLVTRMSGLPPNEPRTIVATGKFVGERFEQTRHSVSYVAGLVERC